MKTDLWNALLTALAAVCLVVILAPVLWLMFSATPEGLWAALNESEVRRSLTVTFFCGTVSTLLGLILGVPLAYLLARRDFRGKRLLQGIIDVPVVIPHPVAGIGLLLVLSIFPRQASPVGHWTGIVLAMFFVSVPFIVNAAQEGFNAVPRRMEWTSHSLGVGSGATFFRLLLPLVRRNILAGAIMMWARSVSEFGSIIILAYNPKTASVLIWDRFSSFGLPHALPVAVILIWLSVILFVAMRRLQERGRGLA